MALDVEHGSFAKQASTGNQTVTMSGSFVPKFIIFYGDKHHTADGIVNDEYSAFRGWTSTTESAAWASSMVSNNKNGQAGLHDGCLLILDQDDTVEAEADIVSMSAGEFVINFTTNANTTASRIFYVAIGGADLTDIKIGAAALNTSTGNQSFTPTTFTPKIGFFAAVGTMTTFPTSSVGNQGTGVGVAVSSSKRFSVGQAVKGDKGHSHFEDTKCLVYPLSSDTALDFEADFVSFNTDGFTINITDAPTTADQLVYVLLGGTNLNVDAGSFTSPTTTGTQAYTTTDEPSLVSLETGLTEVGDVFGDTGVQWSFGAGISATARSNHTWTNPDSKAPESASDDAYVIQGYLANATLTASTEDADIDSFNATDFTLDWTKVSTTAYEYGWWTLGGSAGASHSIIGSITVSTVIAATLAFSQVQALSITGDVAVTPTISSAMAYNQNPSISGEVTVPVTITSGMTYEVSGVEHVIAGAVAVPTTINAALAYNINPQISGDIAVPSTIAAALAYNQNPSITGSVTVPVSVASTTDYTLNASIGGSIPVDVAIASALFYSSGNTILGDITVNPVIASAMDYTFTKTIGGAITVDVVVLSDTAYNQHPQIAGAVSLDCAVASTMQYAAAGIMYGGTYNAVEAFPTLSTVTISLYDPVTGASISLDDNACPEIVTGLYIWDSSKLTAQPSGYQEYVWSMTDSVTVKGGIINMFDAADSAKLDTLVTLTDELHKLQGLDASNPMTVTPISRVAGTISQDITGDGIETSTVTRT